MSDQRCCRQQERPGLDTEKAARHGARERPAPVAAAPELRTAEREGEQQSFAHPGGGVEQVLPGRGHAGHRDHSRAEGSAGESPGNRKRQHERYQCAGARQQHP